MSWSRLRTMATANCATRLTTTGRITSSQRIKTKHVTFWCGTVCLIVRSASGRGGAPASRSQRALTETMSTRSAVARLVRSDIIVARSSMDVHSDGGKLCSPPIFSSSRGTSLVGHPFNSRRLLVAVCAERFARKKDVNKRRVKERVRFVQDIATDRNAKGRRRGSEGRKSRASERERNDDNKKT